MEREHTGELQMEFKKAMEIEDKIKFCRDKQKEIRKDKSSDIETLEYRISHPEEDELMAEMIILSKKDGHKKIIDVTGKSIKEIKKELGKVV